MALTRQFKETIRKRALRDHEFRVALLTEAVNALLEGDTQTGKLVLRDYINATLGFQALAEITGKNEKSLMRMLSQRGNPTAENLFAVIKLLQRHEGVVLEASPQRQGNVPA